MRWSHDKSSWPKPEPRRPFRLLWRWIVGIVAGLAVAGALLLWGPIGLGNGPLSAVSVAGGQILGQGSQAWGLVIPVFPGSSGVVIDQVTLLGGDGYPAPNVLAIGAVYGGPGACGGAAPWRGPESILNGCSNPGGVKPLIGASLPAGDQMVVKIGPPGSSGCWVATSLVIHYHVGIRHYAATIGETFAACRTQVQEHQADLQIGQPN
jgi:hypothetical protein